MKDYDYKYIEYSLIRLLDLLLAVFTDDERNEVQEFIDVGEYALALETLVCIVSEENKWISGKVLMLICELAGMMRMNKKVIEETLSNHVADK
jgi:hypothetical protein